MDRPVAAESERRMGRRAPRSGIVLVSDDMLQTTTTVPAVDLRSQARTFDWSKSSISFVPSRSDVLVLRRAMSRLYHERSDPSSLFSRATFTVSLVGGTGSQGVAPVVNP